jgi:hypothetical protein
VAASQTSFLVSTDGPAEFTADPTTSNVCQIDPSQSVTATSASVQFLAAGRCCIIATSAAGGGSAEFICTVGFTFTQLPTNSQLIIGQPYQLHTDSAGITFAIDRPAQSKSMRKDADADAAASYPCAVDATSGLVVPLAAGECDIVGTSADAYVQQRIALIIVVSSSSGPDGGNILGSSTGDGTADSTDSSSSSTHTSLIVGLVVGLVGGSLLLLAILCGWQSHRAAKQRQIVEKLPAGAAVSSTEMATVGPTSTAAGADGVAADSTVVDVAPSAAAGADPQAAHLEGAHVVRFHGAETESTMG